MEADGELARVPVLVRPFSGQECLLGMNALPALGLVTTRANGESSITKQGSDSKIVNVGMVESVSGPSSIGCFLEVEIDSK